MRTRTRVLAGAALAIVGIAVGARRGGARGGGGACAGPPAGD